MLNKGLNNFVLSSGLMDFQALQVFALYQGKKVANLKVGKHYDFFDVASLTKVIFTTSWFIQAVADNKVKLTKPVVYYLPWYKHSKVTLGELLSHSAGNHWWYPFYKKINGPQKLRYQLLEKLCREAPLQSGGRAVYSDLDFFLLGSVMQEVEKRPLLEIWNDLKRQLYPKTKFHFSTNNEPLYRKGLYAPTEDCPWRKKILQGEVHDENCWSLGGVAPHAGLFGDLNDLVTFGEVLRNSYQSAEDSKLNSEVVRKFSKRRGPVSAGDWGYGFMLKSKKGSSAGELYTNKSFGHTGFTGTSLWYDPIRDLAVGILSNRVHPTRKNKGFIQLRPKIHDWICQQLEA